MPFQLDDGYTLRGETTGKGDAGEPFPVVVFEYRPPLATEMNRFRHMVSSSATAAGVYEARVTFLIARIVSWDIVGADGKTAPITAATLDKLPDPIFLDLLTECCKWKPREQEDAAGNSPRG